MTDANLDQLSERLKQWTTKAVDSYGAKSIYLFGSLIHKGGTQFNESSDIDLVVIMPKLEDALARHRWLEAFREHKEALELQLMRTLRRDAVEPLASVISVTELELNFDIHKDGHRHFFTDNTFRDLHTGVETVGIPVREVKALIDLFRAVLLSLRKFEMSILRYQPMAVQS